MTPFLYCFAEIVLYTLGVMVACGLFIEICYRICFLILGQRTGRFFWYATSWLGSPVHELGHAIMCLLFGHRIEKIRLFPNKDGVALVDHSYKKGNLYAAFGNLWIGLGPIFTGLAVIFAVLVFVYPQSLLSYGNAVNALLETNAPVREVWQCIAEFLRGLLLEETRTFGIRLLAAFILLSMALHVRVSAADVKGMLSGLPCYLALCALVALVFTLLGAEWMTKMTMFLQRMAWMIVSVFSLLAIFAVIQLALIIIYRLLFGIVMKLHGDKKSAWKVEPLPSSMTRDYRDRDWEEFKK